MPTTSTGRWPWMKSVHATLPGGRIKAGAVCEDGDPDARRWGVIPRDGIGGSIPPVGLTHTMTPPRRVDCIACRLVITAAYGGALNGGYTPPITLEKAWLDLDVWAAVKGMEFCPHPGQHYPDRSLDSRNTETP